mmetsp:Transcript_6676/g.15217  ORF Transcript_6676/g.15217 Transcript_6676/m.15217 type:complete len:304 (+) Transcript_6676:754-1665(+)
MSTGTIALMLTRPESFMSAATRPAFSSGARDRLSLLTRRRKVDRIPSADITRLPRSSRGRPSDVLSVTYPSTSSTSYPQISPLSDESATIDTRSPSSSSLRIFRRAPHRPNVMGSPVSDNSGMSIGPPGVMIAMPSTSLEQRPRHFSARSAPPMASSARRPLGPTCAPAPAESSSRSARLRFSRTVIWPSRSRGTLLWRASAVARPPMPAPMITGLSGRASCGDGSEVVAACMALVDESREQAGVAVDANKAGRCLSDATYASLLFGLSLVVSGRGDRAKYAKEPASSWKPHVSGPGWRRGWP